MNKACSLYEWRVVIRLNICFTPQSISICESLQRLERFTSVVNLNPLRKQRSIDYSHNINTSRTIKGQENKTAISGAYQSSPAPFLSIQETPVVLRV